MGVVGTLEVEPVLLARVSDATWLQADVEMHKFARRVHGLHALFHMH